MFLKKHNLKSVSSTNLGFEEAKLLSSMTKGNSSYDEAYTVFDDLFKQRPHLIGFSNPHNLYKNLKGIENFVPKHFEPLDYYNKVTFDRLFYIKSNEEKISSWKI
jgi:hypothetical protein